jgi:UDPglucose 6-dehydrogenase
MVERVRPRLADKALLVILSQVPPGYTRALPMPADQLYYQVETLVFGRAVERATKPERFIVGCADPRQPIAPSLRSFLGSFACPILPMAYESAELAKISINFCLVASITVANTLAEVCERVGADWSDIAPALKLDKRIGQGAYLSPGLGIAGGNLERDLRTIVQIGEAKNTDVGVVKAWLANSAHRKDWSWQVLRDQVLRDHALKANPAAKIAVLGLAYKENTHSTKNSPSLALLEHLRGMSVKVHDPVVSAAVAPWTTGAADPLAAAEGADVLVIATPWPQYRDLKPADLARVMRGRAVLDPYRVLDGHACAAAGLTYHTLGMPPLAPAA